MTIAAWLVLTAGLCAGEAPAEFTVETSHAAWTLGADALTRGFLDKATGTDYAAQPATAFARA